MATDRDIRFRVIVDGKEAERSLKDLQGDLRQTGKLAETSAAGFGAMSQSLAGLAAGFLSARAAIGFFAESLRLAGEQERAVVQLNTALKSTGQYSQAASQELQDYASTLQGLTGNGDETIIGVEKMLATFKLAPDVIKKATLATLDLAEATGQDLMSAAILVGKAAVGETGMLKRYGIVVDEAKLKAEGFKAVLDELRTEFGGQAQARMETYIGKVDALKAAFGDLREAWAKTITRGKALRAVLDGLTGALRTSASQLNETERQTQIRIKEFNAQILFARAHSPKVSKEDRAAALAKLHALEREIADLRDLERAEKDVASANREETETRKTQTDELRKSHVVVEGLADAHVKAYEAYRAQLDILRELDGQIITIDHDVESSTDKVVEATTAWQRLSQAIGGAGTAAQLVQVALSAPGLQGTAFADIARLIPTAAQNPALAIAQFVNAADAVDPELLAELRRQVQRKAESTDR